LKSVDVELMRLQNIETGVQRVPGKGTLIHQVCGPAELNRALWYDFWRRGIVPPGLPASFQQVVVETNI